MFDKDRRQREIATILSLSQRTVHDYVVRFRAKGLPWPLPVEIDEAVLKTRLFTRGALPPSATRPVPDWATVH
jgi:transposase